MSSPVDQRRKVLIAVSNPQSQQYLVNLIDRHISNCQFFYTTDGMDAISKVNNDVPHLLIIEEHLPKKNAIKVTESLLPHKKFDRLAIIIISTIPDQDLFVDEVIMGKVQFSNAQEESFGTYLARAMNFVSHGDNAEFHLSFLAPGEYLMKEGEDAAFVYIVKKGSLQATSHKSGQEVILGTVSPGEFVGEMAYINGEARSASIVATADCELIEIPIEKLDQLLFQKPAWSKALVKTLSRRIKQGNKRALEKA